MTTILEVKYLQLFTITGAPSRTYILTIGSVPTPGYSNPELSAHIYITPPADGIQDFTFSAREPSGGLSPDVISDVAFFGEVETNFSGAKGVRVHGSTNKMEALFDKATVVDFSSATALSAKEGDGSIPWLGRMARILSGGEQTVPYLDLRVSGYLNLMPGSRSVSVGAQLDFSQSGWSASFQDLGDDPQNPGVLRLKLLLVSGPGITIPTTIQAKRYSKALAEKEFYHGVEVYYLGKVVASETLQIVH